MTDRRLQDGLPDRERIAELYGCECPPDGDCVNKGRCYWVAVSDHANAAPKRCDPANWPAQEQTYGGLSVDTSYARHHPVLLGQKMMGRE